MATPKKKSLDVMGVCIIIKACEEHNVSSIKFGELEVVFGTPTGNGPIEFEVIKPSASAVIQNLKPEAEISDQQHVANTREALQQDELELREQQIAELLIVDPVAAEEMIANGELEDVADEPGDE